MRTESIKAARSQRWWTCSKKEVDQIKDVYHRHLTVGVDVGGTGPAKVAKVSGCARTVNAITARSQHPLSTRHNIRPDRAGLT